MDIAKIVIGLALFGVALPAGFYISHQMAGFTVRERLRVVALPAIAMGVYFVALGASTGLQWWTVPSGLAGASLLQLATLHAMDHRPAKTSAPTSA